MDDKEQDDLTAAEALYGFSGWLSTQGGTIQTGSKHAVGPLVELVAEFIKLHNLQDPREGWPVNLKYPADWRER